jgi:hypothetical protein
VSATDASCHGTFECLQTGSRRWRLSAPFRVYQKLHSYWTWHRENTGVRGMLRHALCRVARPGSRGRVGAEQAAGVQPAAPEIPDLRPGELVEVKSVGEILATLDGNRRHKGLLWMTGMSKYCGARYRVHRRVEHIMLESNGELRNMRNTVLLEGVMCDGKAFGACDRSCFHFWRETWLRRVPEPEPDRAEASR